MSPVLSASTLWSSQGPPVSSSPVGNGRPTGFRLISIPRTLSTPNFQFDSTRHVTTERVLPRPSDPPCSGFQEDRYAYQAKSPPLRANGATGTATDLSGVRERLAHCALASTPVTSLPKTPSAALSRRSDSAIFSAATRILHSHNKDCEILLGISYGNFISLTQFVEKNPTKFLRKPKLSYLMESETVIFQWLSNIHEVSIEELAGLFREHTNASLSQPLRVSAHTNYKIITESINAIPDLVVSVSSMRAKLQKHLLVFECAFSQRAEKLFTKVKTLVATLPDICMVFLLQVHEKNRYRSPIETSVAWKRFEDDPHPLTLQHFLQLCEEEEAHEESKPLPEEFMGPVTAGGHVWCNISHVEYYVWLRQTDGKLDINPASMKQTEWSAYGQLPALDDGSNMNHVTEIVNRGLAMVRAAIIETHQTVCEQIQVPVDASLFVMSLNLPPNWNHFRSSLAEAKSLCAFERYQTWYLGTFRGEKHTLSDSDYSSSSQESEPEHPSDKRQAKRPARNGSPVVAPSRNIEN